MKNQEPFTKYEREVMDLLTKAHSIFTEKIDQTHSDDIKDWVEGIHKTQCVLMRRVARRDYPDVFNIIKKFK